MLAELIIAAEETPNPLLPAWYDIVYSLIPQDAAAWGGNP